MMKNRQMDAALKRALREGTNGAAGRKETVWRAVASGAVKMNAERNHEDMKRKRNKLLALTGAAAAVALAAVFFTLTPQGTALAGKLVKFFAPEKRITTDIEGAKETQNAQLAQNTTGEIGYVLYFDAERYMKQSADGVDYYKALNAPEGYPPVQMEISQLKDTDALIKYQEALTDAEKKFDHAEGDGQVTEPVKGWRVLAWDEPGSDAPYEETYIVDNKAGGCFVIRCRMFREAAEGHGARFQAMLKTFEVVRSGSVVTATPLPEESDWVERYPKKLTWETLAIYGVALDTAEDKAMAALKDAIGRPDSDETFSDAGGNTRTLKWNDGTKAIIRNGKLYSLETGNPDGKMPNGLHPGLALDAFTVALGEPHEAIDGAMAWGVGSNDNLIVTVQDGIVKSMKVSLVE